MPRNATFCALQSAKREMVAEKRLKRPLDPIALAKLIGDIATRRTSFGSTLAIAA